MQKQYRVENANKITNEMKIGCFLVELCEFELRE